MLLLLISFIAGVLTILAPCVLPVLPVIIGGSISGGNKDKWRPFVIVTALAGSIIFFTLLLKVSTVLVSLPPTALNYISGGILIALGIVSLFPSTWENLMVQLNWEVASQRFLGKGQQNKSKFIGPVLIGVALGPVFASCSPTYAFILASILPKSFTAGLIYLAAYALGLVLTLLIFALIGIRLIYRFTWAIDTHSTFRRSLGVLFILIGVVIFAGYEVRVETWVANRLPFDESRIEQVLLSKQQKTSIIHKLSQSVSDAKILNIEPAPAPELSGLTNWINSSPLTMQQLRGKVVLVDFWTYSCINCIRTLPYVEKWYQDYHDKGFEVVGVNTPEFAFEHNPDNVAAAVKNFGIHYPVALDNAYATWNAYTNDSWPADYLIDKDGNIRYVSKGEGDYDKTERAIQLLLGINAPIQKPAAVPITQNQTPETYFGSSRAQNYIGTPDLAAGSNTFKSVSPPTNSWTLSGAWQIDPESITSQSSTSTLTIRVSSKDVYMVAGTHDNQPKSVGVSLSGDGEGQYGSDAVNGTVSVSGSHLYHIAALKQFDTTTVTLTVPKGVNLYTFTFGS